MTDYIEISKTSGEKYAIYTQPYNIDILKPFDITRCTEKYCSGNNLMER